MGLFNIFRRKPKMPATIEEGMASQAAEFVEAFRGDGSPVDADAFDYSYESLLLVDRILQDFFVHKAPLPEDLHFLASAYVFECARKQYGGRYMRGDKENSFVLVMGEPECQIGLCAMAKVVGRATNGPEDSLQFFYAGIEEPFNSKVSATIC